MHTRFTSIVLVVAALMLPGGATAAPFYIGNSPLVPPLDGVYVSPANVHATYNGPGLTVILQDIRHGSFSNINRIFGGGGVTETFDSVVSGNASVNGGSLFAVSLVGPVTVFLAGYNVLGQTGTFDTEMQQMDVSGGGVRVRESPTLQSLGRTTIQDIGGGLFRIDSFFDIFTELSLDNGQTWIPSVDSTRVDLTNTPLPAAWLMFLSALGLLGFIRRAGKHVAA